jgi:hypothetical protein
MHIRTIFLRIALVGAVIGGCSGRKDRDADRVDEQDLRSQPALGVATKDEEIAKLRNATTRLRDATNELNETLEIMARLANELFDGRSAELIPDESVCVEFTAAGTAKYVTVDSTGKGMRFNDSSAAAKVTIAPDQLADLFEKLRRLETIVEIDQSLGCRNVAVRMPAGVDGILLTYRRQSGKKRVPIRCTNDDNAIPSADCEDVVRLLYSAQD